MGKIKMLLIYLIFSLLVSNLYSQKVTNADAIYAFNKALEFDKAERNNISGPLKKNMDGMN